MAERVFLDTCVLYPPRLRALLLGLADRDRFQPLWSAGVAAEWARLAARRDPEAAAALPALLSHMTARWPGGEAPRGMPDLLDLPDRGDRHILAAAIAGGATRIVTDNLRDFPRRALAPFGLTVDSPDAFVLGIWLADPVTVDAALAQVWPGHTRPDLRRALKKAGLPRLGKAVAA